MATIFYSDTIITYPLTYFHKKLFILYNPALLFAGVFLQQACNYGGHGATAIPDSSYFWDGYFLRASGMQFSLDNRDSLRVLFEVR